MGAVHGGNVMVISEGREAVEAAGDAILQRFVLDIFFIQLLHMFSDGRAFRFRARLSKQ